MVQTIRIEASPREQAGKGAARATRRAGKVPAVIYGAKQEATLIALDPRDVMKELQKGGWQSSLYEVAVKGGATERTLMRDVQFHPVTDRPLHVDFQRLAAGQLIRVRVPVQFTQRGHLPRHQGRRRAERGAARGRGDGGPGQRADRLRDRPRRTPASATACAGRR